MPNTAKADLPPESDSVSASAEAESDAIFASSAESFRTIGEAATELGLKTHVLRFWETKFDNLRPLKRPDGRRYYRPGDMEMLRQLQNLLHVQGLTIRGAIKVLGDGQGAAVPGESDGDHEAGAPSDAGASVLDLQDAVRDAVERGAFSAEGARDPQSAKARLELLLADLTNLKQRLDTARKAA